MKRVLLASLAAASLACGGTTVTSGSGGASSTTSATTGSGGAGGSSTTTTTGSGGAGGCSPACGAGLMCCDGACVNTGNDINNCGACGQACLGDLPFCGMGTCGDPPCDTVVVCKGAEFCCGNSCCAEGMLCCEVPGPGPGMGPTCTTPENGTCPRGCPACE